MNAQVSLMAGEAMPQELHDLLNSSDGVAFEQALDVLVRQREQRMFRALGLLARDLHDAVRRLGGDLAQEGVPGSVADARQHLEEVLEMSSQAAHGTLDFAERMRPQADALADSAARVIDGSADGDTVLTLAKQAQTFANEHREGMAEFVVAQSWQDLSGQRIKKVVNFIGSVENSLLELVSLTGALASGEAAAGPVKVTSQDEADRLLSEFGF
ncbi:protein phosphatase CheZ [Dyella telluris]|uniref:Protein phosphatase CheZ n=1 Tax=Dyella telluris TaxID=2763498 RepID=A0A7G8Q704_9GAMM|nr:protein phosphatase CheZ [Dyella telluris]QNK02562.1 protein phosphatase CheZ [Dyella telluris]